MSEWVRSTFQAFYAASPLFATGSFFFVWLLVGVAIFLWLKSGGDASRSSASGTPGQEQKVIASPGATAYQAGRDLTVIQQTDDPQERRVRQKVKELAPQLEALIGLQNAIWRDITGDPNQLQNLATYQKRIQDARELVGNFCDKELSNSGARSLALPKDGPLNVGPIRFELGRLEKSVEGQRAILTDMERYVRRSLQ